MTDRDPPAIVHHFSRPDSPQSVTRQLLDTRYYRADVTEALLEALHEIFRELRTVNVCDWPDVVARCERIALDAKGAFDAAKKVDR